MNCHVGEEVKRPAIQSPIDNLLSIGDIVGRPPLPVDGEDQRHRQMGDQPAARKGGAEGRPDHHPAVGAPRPAGQDGHRPQLGLSPGQQPAD